MYRLLLQHHGVIGFLAHAQDVVEGAWFDNLRFKHRHMTNLAAEETVTKVSQTVKNVFVFNAADKSRIWASRIAGYER